MNGDLEARLAREAGLDLRTLGPTAIARAVQGRMLATGVACREAYTALWESDPAERQALLGQLIVPETWFFRDGEPFAALARHVAGPWRAAHAAGALRVLSIPCSTGEEPYSIAMALEGVGFPAERLELLGVDVSPTLLEQARVARYGAHSFRGVGEATRQSYFTPCPGRPGCWQLGQSVRQNVRFEQGDLLAADFAATHGVWDAVFCRNLLIYLNEAARARVLETLGRLLAPGGIVFVGHAEAYLLHSAGFEPCATPAAFAFHKPGSRPVAPPPRPQRPFAMPPPKPPPQVAPPPPPPPVRVGESLLEEATRLADAGQGAQAARLARESLEREGPSARAFYLLAVLSEVGGDPEAAATFYRKALYLEPRHREALAHLSLLARRRGDSRTADRLRERLDRIEKEGESQAPFP